MQRGKIVKYGGEIAPELRDKESYSALLRKIKMGDSQAESKLVEILKKLPHAPRVDNLKGSRNAKAYALALDDYLDREMQRTIATDKKETPIKLASGGVIDRTDGKPVRGYHAAYRPGHPPYKVEDVNYGKMAAAIIGITVILLLGTSFLTGQISGAAVVQSLSELNESSQFPYTFLAFLIVAFLFSMLWMQAQKPQEVKA